MSEENKYKETAESVIQGLNNLKKIASTPFCLKSHLAKMAELDRQNKALIKNNNDLKEIKILNALTCIILGVLIVLKVIDLLK